MKGRSTVEIHLGRRFLIASAVLVLLAIGVAAALVVTSREDDGGQPTEPSAPVGLNESDEAIVQEIVAKLNSKSWLLEGSIEKMTQQFASISDEGREQAILEITKVSSRQEACGYLQAGAAERLIRALSESQVQVRVPSATSNACPLFD